MKTTFEHHHHIAISEQTHKRWEKELNEHGVLYIFAMTGYGKTVQAEAFAKEHFKKSAEISAAEEGFLEEISAYVTNHRRPKVRTLLIVDDLHCLHKEEGIL